MMTSGHLGSYLLLLLEGAGVTLELSLGALILGSIGGMALGAMRGSRRRFVKAAAIIYIEGLRSTPFVILLFLIYYAVPVALDLDIPPYPAAISALSLHCSAYMAEVVRSGIESVAKGQWEAARALGFGYSRIMGLVILPQALRVMIPPTIGVYVSTLKESSLASIIGFVELLGQGMAIRESNAGRSTADVLLAVAIGYFIICFALSRLGLRLERWASRESRAPAAAGAVVRW